MKNADEPAFSLDGEFPGLTKREYFAGLAMQGLLANPHVKWVPEMGGLCTVAADNLLKALEAPPAVS